MTVLIGSRQPESLSGIKVDSPEWFAWLEEQKSFRFECSYTWHIQAGIADIKSATCTVIKQGKYWNAQKRVSGQLRRYYLGASDKLTYDGLCEAAKTLTINPKWCDYLRAKQSPGLQSHKKEINDCETEDQATCQTRDKAENLQARFAELEARLKEKDEELTEAKTKVEILEKESRQLRYRCSDLERENARLERLGTDYSHATFQVLQGKYQKALDNAKHWEETAKSYDRQAEAIAKKREEAEDEIEKLEAKLSEAVARIVELEPLQLRISGMEDTMRYMHNELLTRPHPDDLIRRKVSELGMQEKLMQHQADPKSNVRYWALARLLEALE
jgi:BMFP domain-containing protein YqiC